VGGCGGGGGARGGGGGRPPPRGGGAFSPWALSLKPDIVQLSKVARAEFICRQHCDRSEVRYFMVSKGGCWGGVCVCGGGGGAHELGGGGGGQPADLRLKNFLVLTPPTLAMQKWLRVL